MPSSEVNVLPGMHRTASLLAAGVLLAACSAPPVAERPPAPASPPAAAQTASSSVTCTIAPSLSPEDMKAGVALRTTTEGGPLYAAIAASATLQSCRVGSDAGAATLDYTFSDGSSLQVTRDARIEYSNHEATLVSPLEEDPVAVLTRTERASFAPDGCGIDWSTSETAAIAGAPGTTETIHRGDVCNCQARVRTDATGRVVALIFRSAC